MRKTIPACLALALALALCPASAAPSQAGRERVRFEHLSTRQGLSRAVVYDILQDSRGFMWFALEGALNRYDGISFRVYEPDPENENSISAGAVNVLFEDSRNRLWIGTRKGLNRFDPETEAFSCFRHDANDPESIDSDDVTAVRPDPQRDSIPWAGTDSGLARMDTESGRFERFRHDPADESTPSHDHVMAIGSFPETGSVLWIGTMVGLNRFDPDSGTFRRYVHDPSDPRSPGYDPVYDVCCAGDGKPWVGVHGGGLCRMDPASETFETFAHDPSDPYSLSNNDTHPLLADRVGALWVGSRGGGADRYDPDVPKFTLYRRNSGVEHGLSHSSISGMLEDREGFVWIGSAGGELTRFDPSTERFSNFRHDPDDPDSLIHDTVFVLREDSRGTLWVGAWDGAEPVRPRNRRLRTLPARRKGRRQPRPQRGPGHPGRRPRLSVDRHHLRRNQSAGPENRAVRAVRERARQSGKSQRQQRLAPVHRRRRNALGWRLAGPEPVRPENGNLRPLPPRPEGPEQHRRRSRDQHARGPRRRSVAGHPGGTEPHGQEHGPVSRLHGQGRFAPQHGGEHRGGRPGLSLAVHGQGGFQIRSPRGNLRQLRRIRRTPGGQVPRLRVPEDPRRRDLFRRPRRPRSLPSGRHPKQSPSAAGRPDRFFDVPGSRPRGTAGRPWK